MIRNQWYVVLESQEVKHKPIGVTRMGEKLVFWRDAQGQVHCLRDRCAHRGAALSTVTTHKLRPSTTTVVWREGGEAGHLIAA